MCRHESYKKVNSRQDSSPQDFGNVSSSLIVAPCSGCTRFQCQFKDNSKTNSIQAGQCQCEFLNLSLRTKDWRAAPPTISRQVGHCMLLLQPWGSLSGQLPWLRPPCSPGSLSLLLTNSTGGGLDALWLTNSLGGIL